MTTRIRRARRSDAAAIGRVHVETWQSSYAGLLPDALLVAMSDVRQSAWWSRALADPDQARDIFVADDEERGVVGFDSQRRRSGDWVFAARWASDGSGRDEGDGGAD